MYIMNQFAIGNLAKKDSVVSQSSHFFSHCLAKKQQNCPKPCLQVTQCCLLSLMLNYCFSSMFGPAQRTKVPLLLLISCLLSAFAFLPVSLLLLGLYKASFQWKKFWGKLLWFSNQFEGPRAGGQWNKILPLQILLQLDMHGFVYCSLACLTESCLVGYGSRDLFPLHRLEVKIRIIVYDCYM